MRLLLMLFLLAIGASVVVACRDPEELARASDTIAAVARAHASPSAAAVQIPRGQGGEFAIHARINGVRTPMVIDTGATSVVLTYETAKAIGLPLELLEYDTDVETAGGHTRAARLTLNSS